MQIKTRNDHILSELDAFAVATPYNRKHLDPTPFGVPTRWHISPYEMGNATFFELLQSLDALTFGPEGMPMDKWVFYNCAELPGFIYGFALEASRLSAHERELMRVPTGYVGPVPFSMYIAIPMHEPGAWFGHNLASLNRTFRHRGFNGLATITKAIALKAYRAERFCGATQWLSKALFIHTRFGPLDLMTTYTPAHSIPETLTYGFDVTDAALRYAAGDPTVQLDFPEPTQHVDARDVHELQQLQHQIEAGARYQLVGPPVARCADIVHPIRKVG